MKILVFFMLFLCTQNTFSEECDVSFTKDAPFMVSDATGMKNKTYENFKSKKNYKKNESIIPKRSIVKIQKGSEEFANHPDYYIPVEVISTPDTSLLDNNLEKGRYRRSSANRNSRKLKKVELGKKGFIYSKSLKKADKYTYILKEDSPLIQANGLSGKGVVALKPNQDENGNYMLVKCCEFDFLKGKMDCSTHYSFLSVFSNDTVGKDILLDTNSCTVTSSLTPFKNKDIIPIMNILETGFDSNQKMTLDRVEFWDSKGLVKIPLDYNDSDGKGFGGPHGSYHYNTDDKGASDVLANPTAACIFMKVLKKHSKSCQGEGCQIQFGDIWHPKDLGVHSSHFKGECFDVRPLKKKTSRSALDFRDSNYDRKKTQNLINLFTEAGATKIIFDDRKVSAPVIRRTSDRSHENHLHVCFDPKRSKSRKACELGI